MRKTSFPIKFITIIFSVVTMCKVLFWVLNEENLLLKKYKINLPIFSEKER